jgi:hypothetical protein
MIQTARSGRRSWPFGTSKECDGEMEQRTRTNYAIAIAILQNEFLVPKLDFRIYSAGRSPEIYRVAERLHFFEFEPWQCER